MKQTSIVSLPWTNKTEYGSNNRNKVQPSIPPPKRPRPITKTVLPTKKFSVHNLALNIPWFSTLPIEHLPVFINGFDKIAILDGSRHDQIYVPAEKFFQVVK